MLLIVNCITILLGKNNEFCEQYEFPKYTAICMDPWQACLYIIFSVWNNASAAEFLKSDRSQNFAYFGWILTGFFHFLYLWSAITLNIYRLTDKASILKVYPLNPDSGYQYCCMYTLSRHNETSHVVDGRN